MKQWLICNWDSIVDFMAIAGFVLSFLIAIFTAISQRRNFKIKIFTYCHTRNRHFFFAAIDNKSRLPISITQVAIISDKKKFYCRMIPKKVIGSDPIRETNKETRELVNLPIPIQLDGLCSTSGFLVIEDEKQELPTLSTPVKLEVSSNRGSLLKIELELGQVLDYRQWTKFYIP